MSVTPKRIPVLVDGPCLRVFDDGLRGAVGHDGVAEEQSGRRELEELQVRWLLAVFAVL